MARVRSECVAIDHYGHSITLKGGELLQTVSRFFNRPELRQCEISTGTDDDVVIVDFPRGFTLEFIYELIAELKAYLFSIGHPVYNHLTPPGLVGFLEMPIPC